MESIRQYRGLSKEVYVLFLATVINLMNVLMKRPEFIIFCCIVAALAF